MAAPAGGRQALPTESPPPTLQFYPNTAPGSRILIAISIKKLPWQFLVLDEEVSRDVGWPAGYACGHAMPASEEDAMKGERVSARSIVTDVFKEDRYGWQKGAWAYVAGLEGKRGQWTKVEGKAGHGPQLLEYIKGFSGLKEQGSVSRTARHEKEISGTTIMSSVGNQTSSGIPATTALLPTSPFGSMFIHLPLNDAATLMRSGSLEGTGRGGYGVVEKVELPGVGVVAVKIYGALLDLVKEPPSFDLDDSTVEYKARVHSARTALSNALRAGLQLQHENLLPLRGVVRHEGSGEAVGVIYDYYPYTLYSWCSRHHANMVTGIPHEPLDRQCLVLCDVARAAQHLHSCGLIHRDIKPPNILITSDGRGILGDPDLLTVAGRRHLQAGTPGYRGMEGESATTYMEHSYPFDVFSAGATLAFILCGSTPTGNAVFKTGEFVEAAMSRYGWGRKAPQGSEEFVTSLVELAQECMARSPSDRMKKCRSRGLVMKYFEQSLRSLVAKFRDAQV